ncbi:MAG: GNAT family N-acetyltransferase [Actinomycetota bacterium]|nr:GNAT family N-acetyltransferase [Actinomycetota bacterium]
MGVTLRPLAVRDAPELLRMFIDNRAFFAPWDPVREEDYFTLSKQESVIRAEISARDQGQKMPFVITLDGTGEIIGTININDIVRGVFQSANLGYEIAEKHNGRGYATAAVGLATAHAFKALGLHRVQAGTLLHNVRSQRVLEKNGFRREGVALRYLRIAGEWQDHIIFAKTIEE